MNYKTVLLIIAAGYLAAACSTQVVPDQTQDQAYSTAVGSYTNCQATGRPYNSGDTCDAVYPSNNHSMSYNGYVYGKAQRQISVSAVNVSESASINTESSEKAAQLAKNEAVLRSAYLAALRTASVEDLQELSAKWDALAAQSAQAQ